MKLVEKLDLTPFLADVGLLSGCGSVVASAASCIALEFALFSAGTCRLVLLLPGWRKVECLEVQPLTLQNIGGFRVGAEGAAPPLFFLYFQNVLRFCFENRFIKCSLILSSETLKWYYDQIFTL